MKNARWPMCFLEALKLFRFAAGNDGDGSGDLVLAHSMYNNRRLPEFPS